MFAPLPAVAVLPHERPRLCIQRLQRFQVFLFRQNYFHSRYCTRFRRISQARRRFLRHIRRGGGTHERTERGSNPRLMRMALSTRDMVAGGSSPIRDISRFLSMVRICSSRMTESFASPKAWGSSMCVSFASDFLLSLYVARLALGPPPRDDCPPLPKLYGEARFFLVPA